MPTVHNDIESAYRYTLTATRSFERYLILGTPCLHDCYVMLLKNHIGKVGLTRRYMRHLPAGGPMEYLKNGLFRQPLPGYTPYSTILGVPTTNGYANLQERLGAPWPFIVCRLGISKTQRLVEDPRLEYRIIHAHAWPHTFVNTATTSAFFFDKGDMEVLNRLFLNLARTTSDKIAGY